MEVSQATPHWGTVRHFITRPPAALKSLSNSILGAEQVNISITYHESFRIHCGCILQPLWDRKDRSALALDDAVWPSLCPAEPTHPLLSPHAKLLRFTLGLPEFFIKVDWLNSMAAMSIKGIHMWGFYAHYFAETVCGDVLQRAALPVLAKCANCE